MQRLRFLVLSLVVHGIVSCALSPVNKLLPVPVSSSAFPMCFSIGFSTSGFTLRSLMHFELIFIWDGSCGFEHILLWVSVQFFLNHYFFSLACFWCLCQKLSGPSFVSGPSVPFYWSTCLLLCQYHCYCSSMLQFGVRYLNTYMAFLLWELLWLHMVFCVSIRMFGYFSSEECFWNFCGNRVESVDYFW